jgi:hypothetical protein
MTITSIYPSAPCPALLLLQVLPCPLHPYSFPKGKTYQAKQPRIDQNSRRQKSLYHKRQRAQKQLVHVVLIRIRPLPQHVPPLAAKEVPQPAEAVEEVRADGAREAVCDVQV